MTVGFSLAFGDSIHGLIGTPATYFLLRGVGGATEARLSTTIPLILFALFQLKFAIITPALITGSFAERVRLSSYIVFMVLFSLVIYAPLANWTWHPDGFLRKWGVLDFAGGTVVHISAGIAALTGARVLGRRKRSGSSEAHTPAVAGPWVHDGRIFWQADEGTVSEGARLGVAEKTFDLGADHQGRGTLLRLSGRRLFLPWHRTSLLDLESYAFPGLRLRILPHSCRG